MHEIRNVVFATDLSESSQLALETMRFLWPRLEGNLTILHVAPESGFSILNTTDEEEAQIIGEKLGALEAMVEEFGENTESVLLRGDPPKAIADYIASRGDVDMLVMGRHYYSRLQRLLTGVVADIVAREVKCPVLRC